MLPEKTMAIVVLNWNSAPDTLEAVRGIPISWREHVIVVDNGSDDWESEFLVLSRLEKVRLRRRDTNGGYAAGMNDGMQLAARAGYRYAALVNSDARPDARTLEQLCAVAPGYAALGTAQRGPAGRYITAARGKSLFPAPFDCSGCCCGVHDVDVISGATIVIDLEKAERLGWLDENFFHYAEEVDFCIRLRAAGERIGWSCQTVVDHKVGGSMPRDSAAAHYYSARNKILLCRKHATGRWISLRLIKDEMTLLARAIRTRQPRAWGRGVWDGLTCRQGKVAI